MPTNGSRNAAASSHALNVGAQTPMSGENASPTPCPTAVPFKPLASAYVRTALMNETPTSGPIATSITHQDRDAISSRHSLRRSHARGECRSASGRPSRERKEHLFQVSTLGPMALAVSTLGLMTLAVATLGPTTLARRLGGLARQLVERAFAADAPAAQQHEAIA